MDKKTLNRFWNKVKKTNYCWTWIACKNICGYGLFNLNGKIIGAHRISYELVNGSIPKGLELDHLCKNPLCVNPDHLEAVTHRENLLRGETSASINAKKTHCIRGHEFTPENTYLNQSKRRCKICDQEYHKKYGILHKIEITEYQKKYRSLHTKKLY